MASSALVRRTGWPARVQTAVRWCAFAFAIAILFVTHIAPALAQDRIFEQPIRIRIAWGGNAPERWSGWVALEGGKLTDVQLLGMEADAAAAVRLEDNVLEIDTPSPHLFDGVDVTATAGADARLSFSLAVANNAPPIAAQVALSDIVRGPYRLPLDERGNELLIQRAPGDSLRISTNREQLIFRPGEQFTFDLEPLLEGIEPSTTIDITTTLIPARGSNPLWSHEQRLPVPVEGPAIATMHVPLPRDEGVYAIRLAVARPPGFRQRFFPGGGPQPLVERTFQVVVLANSPPAPKVDSGWVSVLEIDPANPTWTDRLPKWTQFRIPGLSQRPLGSQRAATVVHPLGNFVELPPTPASGEPHWQAYPLPLEAVGEPHLLEVEYPNDQEQHLGISIVEPNAAGRIIPIGRDSGVYVEGLGHAEKVAKSKHRVVFWPRTNAPFLLVTNQHPTAAAKFGSLRVLKRIGGSVASSPWPQSRGSDRLVAAYLSRPLVPESFGASEGLDRESGQSVDDWQTFYEGATRLAEYLNHGGYNAAVVNVMADGSALFNSKLVPSTPLHNTGRMVAGASDLPDVDALELMFQVFDRSGLSFIPTLQFAAPLPELEALRRGKDPRQEGIELVNAEGRTWREIHKTDRGLAPHYNLLDERVQRAMLHVAKDVMARYGSHRSCAGLGVQLSGRGYAVLPDVEWGLDESTIDRFERERELSLPQRGIGERQLAVLRDYPDEWRSWRAKQVTDFYRELAAVVHASGSSRRLLLTTEDMFATPELVRRIRPNIVAKTRIDRMMLELGIDRDALREAPGIVFCPTRFVGSAAPLVDRAVELEINEAFASARRETRNPNAAAMLFYHRPVRRSLPSFDAKSPVPAHMSMVIQSSAHAPLALGPYVAALVDADPTIIIDGGELLPTGDADAVRDARRILQSLPTSAAVSTKREKNVLIRTYATQADTTCLVVNELPWHADTKIELDVPLDAVARPVGINTERDRQSFAAGRQTWTIQLAPYQVHAMRFSVGGVEVASIESTPSAAGQRELAARRADLRHRDLNAAKPTSGLENPGFEPRGGAPLAGWRLAEGAGFATAELDATAPHEGQTSLYLQNHAPDGVATLESNPFPTPPTGRLAMLVFVRGRNLSPNSEVRLVFEVDGSGAPYRRFTTLGGPRSGSQPLGNEWASGYAFRAEDLPLDSRSRMRVKFELAGPGEIWIDDVKLYDLLFPLWFYEHAQAEKFRFVQLITAVDKAFEEGRLSECVELLDGYWPRFLAAYTPIDTVKVAEQPKPPEDPAPPPPRAEEPPSVIGRWFSWPGTQKR